MKPATTSAASTAFCATELHHKGCTLYIDGNGKITAGNGTLDAPSPNAFSLLHIEDCPGSTPTCRASCYVHGLAKHAAPTYELYRHNSVTIREILAGGTWDLLEWADVFAKWITEHAAGGFRWHVSGDVFSSLYADWIAEVCRSSPGVRHWIYTRSLAFVGSLARVSTARGGNLSLNLSCDRDNWMRARLVAERTGARLCFLTPDGTLPTNDYLRDGDVIFPDYALRGGTEAGAAWFAALPAHHKAMVCPVDYHGKAPNRRCGPCDRCMK